MVVCLACYLVDELVVYWVWMLVVGSDQWTVAMLAVCSVGQMVAWTVDW